MKFIRGLFNKFHLKMITSVRFCLSYDLLNAVLSPSKFVYIHENICIIVMDAVMILLV